MSSLQHKIKNYEVVPPANVWSRIAADLDQASGDFSTRLYGMEVPPPAAAWENIAASLDSTRATVVPMRKRTAGFFRYAVAAAFIGIAAFGIIKWTTGSTESTGIAGTDTAVNVGKARENKLPGSPENTTGSPVTTDIVAEPGKTGPAAHQPGTVTRKSSDRAATQAGYYETSGAERTAPVYAYEDHLPDMAGRYITLMTPDGNLIRMSKKWEDMVCCVSGEEQDDDCKTQLKKWQQKIAASSQATSPGNFLDILNLVSSLDDNTGL